MLFFENISNFKIKSPPVPSPPQHRTHLMKTQGILWFKFRIKIWVLGKHLGTQNKIPPPHHCCQLIWWRTQGILYFKFRNQIWVLGKHLGTKNNIPPPHHCCQLIWWMTKEPCELKSKMKCEDAGRSRPKLKQTNNMKLNSDSSKTSLPSKVDIQCIHLFFA